MTEPIKTDATTKTDAEVQEETKAAEDIKTAEAGKTTTETKVDSQETGKSLLDEASAEEKEQTVAEEKRLLETPDDKLSEEDKVKKADLVKAKDEAAKAKVVPEKYEFKVPEGMTLDQEYADKASVIMKKHGITQAAATELGEMAAGQIKKITEEAKKQADANFNTFVEDLKKETMTELAKDGKDAKKELIFAAKSRDRLASPGLIEKLNKSGLANDIDVVRHFIAIGKAISEGKLAEGQSEGAGDKDALKTLYPKTAT